MQVTRRTNKSSDLLAWWTLGTRHDMNDHASLRPASAQVSSTFRAGFGPASIMDFGLYMPHGKSENKTTKSMKAAAAKTFTVNDTCITN